MAIAPGRRRPSEPAPLLQVWRRAISGAHTGQLRRTGVISNPISVDAVYRHNLASSITCTVPTTHHYAAALVQPGARLTLDYNGQRISGPISQLKASGPRAGMLTATVAADDFAIVSKLLGWPNPGGAITAQGAAAAHDTRTGPAERVLKGVLSANLARLGIASRYVIPGTSATWTRGATITAAFRMDKLVDKLFPLVDAAGIGLSVIQGDDGLLHLDVYQPRTYPHLLTEDSGTVQTFEASRAGPQVTRTVVGGQGEGTAREFRLRLPADAREAIWDDVVETFTDARDTSDGPTLDARGDAALAEGAPTYGLALSLIDTPSFRYGTHYARGDVVAYELASGVMAATDVLREAHLTWTLSEGVLVQPVIGDRSDEPGRRLAALVSSALRALRVDRAGT